MITVSLKNYVTSGLLFMMYVVMYLLVMLLPVLLHILSTTVFCILEEHAEEIEAILSGTTV